MSSRQQSNDDPMGYIHDLLQRVAALEQRLDEIAHEQETPRQRRDRTAVATDSQGTPDELFWALEGLREREPDPGAVMIVGSVQTPGGVAAQWQLGAGTEDLLDDEWDSAATVLDALGHPVRLRILKEVIHGRGTAKELAQVEAMGSTGQVYHHLRILTAAGWLRARAGGEHEVPAERLVPLLTCILGGRR